MKDEPNEASIVRTMSFFIFYSRKKEVSLMFAKESALQWPLIECIWPERSLARNALLVLGTSFLLAIAAQVAIPLPFSPVPVTLQTLVVLLAGAVLGSRLGTLSVLAYLAQGAVGLPFFAKGSAGLAYLRGVTGGYLLGFIVVAYVVGLLVERGWGKRLNTAVGAMLLGNVILYAFGLPWLHTFLGISWHQTLIVGLYPFILGDLYKIGLASALLPLLWQFFGNPKSY
jgi:biotin transport system substrate-specific component